MLLCGRCISYSNNNRASLRVILLSGGGVQVFSACEYATAHFGSITGKPLEVCVRVCVAARCR